MDDYAKDLYDGRLRPGAGSIVRLRLGGQLNADAYTRDGALIYKAGGLISDERQLQRLRKSDIRFNLRMEYKKYIANSEPEDQPCEPHDMEQMDSPARVRAAALKTEAAERLETVFDRIEETGRVDIPAILETVSGLASQLARDGDTFASIVQLKNADAYTFTHSVNVCIMTMYLAMHMNLGDELQHIGSGALLHDIGKIRTPMSVLHKEGPLNTDERDIIQHHPSEGLNLLLNSGFHDSIAIACVQDHHETLTGTGYPRHKRACDISPYAKIISLADVYDALTTDRPYRRALTHDEALTIMVSKMSAQFDPWLLHRFVETIGNLTQANGVSNGAGPECTAKSILRHVGPVPRLDATA